MIYRNCTYSCTSIHHLIRRISYYCIKCHVVFIVCFPEAAAVTDFVDERRRVVFYYVYKVFIILCIHSRWTEAYESAAGYAASHWSLADYEYVLLHCRVPKALGKGTVYVAIFLTGFLHATAVDVVCHEERVETAL